jgi:hypothetical protein
MIPCDPSLHAAAERALRQRAAEHRRAATQSPVGTLSPVQNWLIGRIDFSTLRDQVMGMQDAAQRTSMIAAIGEAMTDDAYAAALILQAQDALEAQAEGVAGGGTGHLELANLAERYADHLSRLDGRFDSTPETEFALVAAVQALRRQGLEQAADELHELRQRLSSAAARTPDQDSGPPPRMRSPDHEAER